MVYYEKPYFSRIWNVWEGVNSTFKLRTISLKNKKLTFAKDALLLDGGDISIYKRHVDGKLLRKNSNLCIEANQHFQRQKLFIKRIGWSKFKENTDVNITSVRFISLDIA